MTTVTTESLQELVANALERMAFVFTDPSEVTPGEVLTRTAANAVIELSGAHQKVVTVSATAGIVQEITSGMMGCDPDEIDVDDHARAAVGELANVFGGELVMALADEEFAIGLPRDADDDEVGRLIDEAAKTGVVTIVGSEMGELMISVSC